MSLQLFPPVLNNLATIGLNPFAASTSPTAGLTSDH
jgi:hypothetical protein